MKRSAVLAAVASFLLPVAAARADVDVPPVRLPDVTVELPAGSPPAPSAPSVGGVEVPVKVVNRSEPAGSASPPGSASQRTSSSADARASTGEPAGARHQPDRPGRGAHETTRSAGTRAASTAQARARRGAAAGPATRRRPQTRARGELPHAEAVGAFGRLPLPLPVPDWSKPIILGLLLASLGLGVRSRLAARRARRLDAQRAELARDLAVVQSTLTPDVPDRIGDLDLSVAYRPADGPASGGDFYDVVEIGAGRVAIIVGDASGHGRGALARATLTRYTLRAYLQAGLEPRAALQLGGEVLAGDGEEFTTVVIAVHDPATSTLAYATAGHPPPIILDAPFGEPALAWACPPIGWGVPTGRTHTLLSLPRGAVVCFYTDGLAEARTGDKMLGRQGVSEILASLGPSPTAPAVLERLRAIADRVADDMALCLLRPRREADAHFRVEELELERRQLTGPRTHHFLRQRGLSRVRIAEAIQEARLVADRQGSAVLRVRVESEGASVAVASPYQRAPARDRLARAEGARPAKARVA